MQQQDIALRVIEAVVVTTPEGEVKRESTGEGPKPPGRPGAPPRETIGEGPASRTREGAPGGGQNGRRHRRGPPWEGAPAAGLGMMGRRAVERLPLSTPTQAASTSSAKGSGAAPGRP